mgnify:CR=1 FL=1
MVRSPPTTVTPLDDSQAVGPQVYRSLRERIVRTQLAPGSRMSEAETAVMYGTSRQPVREAFSRLADDGLVEIRPQRATLVTRISRTAVLEARFLREAIEADLARAAARQRNAATVALLESLLQEQSAVPVSDPERFMPLDEAFHRTIGEAAGHAHAWQVIEGFKVHMDRVRFLALRRFPIEALITQHRVVAEAIVARRPAAAEHAMREHLNAIIADLPAIVLANPELFDEASSSTL